MNVLLYILKELWALVAEDGLFTLVIFAWIGAVACLTSSFPNGTWGAPLLLIGQLAILSFSVASIFHRRTPTKTKRSIKS